MKEGLKAIYQKGIKETTVFGDRVYIVRRRSLHYHVRSLVVGWSLHYHGRSPMVGWSLHYHGRSLVVGWSLHHHGRSLVVGWSLHYHGRSLMVAWSSQYLKLSTLCGRIRLELLQDSRFSFCDSFLIASLKYLFLRTTLQVNSKFVLDFNV